jgi:hypothetical protein
MKIDISNTSPKIKLKKQKMLEEWSNRDFLIYYSVKQQEITGCNLNIPPKAWPGFLARIKGFRAEHELSNEAYKIFLDDVFNMLYTQKFVPAFSAIISEKVYNLIQRYKTQSMTNSEFEMLRARLYNDNSLFKSLVSKIAEVEI